MTRSATRPAGATSLEHPVTRRQPDGDSPCALIRSAIEQGLAFNRHVGIEILAADATAGVARLPEADHVLNHVGTVHAAALFLVGECAAGAAFAGAFFEELARMTFVARGAEISYVAPARGAVTATAALDRSPDTVVAALAGDRRARVVASVALRDATGALVAELTLHYHVTPS